MNTMIETFNAHLRSRVGRIHDRLDALGARTDTRTEDVEAAIRTQIEVIESEAQHAKGALTAARATVKAWVRDAQTTVTEWKTQDDRARLDDRAERAAQLAEATLVIAVAAVERAERTMLKAWLAEADAQSWNRPKAA
ncbi:hypothetical protein [Prosthecodimorpha staleyi]|uniref:Uncharacterized protein n=1 Tax=Prosthecodimorpha staleyi TaxID=2840188 RepID=A0A947D954_9HYPH|nr:hypothetical protein [Prosthecodimorpha staleyi]MBT9292688.1 hypothetical protein [Prosthecodimorpha staleyi]